MAGALTLRFSTQAQLDIRRMTRDLSDLQAQVASGAKAKDLQGFGGAAGQLLNAQSLKSTADAHISVITQLEARFGVQASAQSQVANAAGLLAQTIRDAISANDGRGIAVDLPMSFSSIVSALNETWNGQPLFAGERQSGSPVKINSLDELMAAAGPDDVFDESTRYQTIDLGSGVPIKLADKASDMAQPLFDTIKQLKSLLDGSGGTIGAPISTTQTDTLTVIAEQLEREANDFTSAEGRTGQLQTRFSAERVRLQDRSNLLLKEIGDQADADIAEISVQINSLLVQYQASAKVFADLSQLSLLDYL
ncbi:flagellin [Terricaulis sp.]|uniref:flagellin n=1 Tax=Terricaulis sp. TaxID=2768686 RepID=UPI0037840758